MDCFLGQKQGNQLTVPYDMLESGQGPHDQGPSTCSILNNLNGCRLI